MGFLVISGGTVKGATDVTSSLVSFDDQTETYDALLLSKSLYFRRFFQKEGTVTAGTWTWLEDADQTDFTTQTNELAGFWYNVDGVNLDEYKWSSIFLAKNIYKVTIIHTMMVSEGIAEVLFGVRSLGTKNFYNSSFLNNQTWEITFALTQDTTADLRFRVNGKTLGDYFVSFSRFQIEKIG